MDGRFCEGRNHRREARVRAADSARVRRARSSEARLRRIFFSLTKTGSKITSSCWDSERFDSVTKNSEFPNHACCTALLGLFGYCRTAFLILNAPMQNEPNQMTKAMHDHADSFVVS